MDDSDLVRLRHMLEAAQTGVSFVQGETRVSLDHDLKLVFALVRAVEIIGEAATKISDKTRNEYPQIPWKKITGMRHILSHDYYRVNLDVVWQTATVDLPGLIAELDPIIQAIDEQD